MDCIVHGVAKSQTRLSVSLAIIIIISIYFLKVKRQDSILSTLQTTLESIIVNVVIILLILKMRN